MKNILPDPFIFADGSSVQTSDDWHKRRKEIIKSILDIEYGPLPPSSIVRAEKLHSHGPVERLLNSHHVQYRLNIENGARPFWFILDLLIPKDDEKSNIVKKYPVVINGDGCWKYLSDEIATELLSRKYILATFNRTEIVPDIYRSERDSALYLVYPDLAFGALSAWAWGYHRVVDFLLTQEYVDGSKIAIVGHSRGGKAVLLAGATDERIALTSPNNSGCGGAGCFRFCDEKSESLEQILKAIPYWFSPRLKEYIGKEDSLPFDQHSLKALVAPRALLSTEALGDLWANPTGTYQTYRAAREVYRFLNAENNIGICYREGEHKHGIDDWKTFLDFADMHFHGKACSTDFNKNPFPDLT